MADTDKKLKITLVRSTIGAVRKNKEIVESMGLRKIGKSVILPDPYVPYLRSCRFRTHGRGLS